MLLHFSSPHSFKISSFYNLWKFSWPQSSRPIPFSLHVPANTGSGADPGSKIDSGREEGVKGDDDDDDDEEEEEDGDDEHQQKIMKQLAFPAEMERSDISASSLVIKVNRAIQKRLTRLGVHKTAFTALPSKNSVQSQPLGRFLKYQFTFSLLKLWVKYERNPWETMKNAIVSWA